MKETTILTIMLVKLGIILALTLAVLKQGDYYEAREQGARLFCVEQKAKHKFCEKYFQLTKKEKHEKASTSTRN